MKTRILLPGRELLNFMTDNIETAEETIILAALVTDGGLQQILSSLRTAKEIGNRVKFIFGTGMPATSSPNALEELFPMHDDKLFKLLWYNGDAFFHPKVFMFRHGSQWSVLLGSSNLTEGGIQDNVEFNCLITNLRKSNPVVATILGGIREIESDSKPITRPWLAQFKKKCESIRRGHADLVERSQRVRRDLKKQQQVDLRRWDALLKAARKFKKTPAYKERLRNTPNHISACKRTIGSAKHPQVNVKRWGEKKVGYFSNLDSRNYANTIPNTPRELARLNKVLKYLLDTSIPLEDRIAGVVPTGGRYHINGMGISHATDILNKYFPKEYIVLNDPIVETLHHYGIRHFSSDPVQRYRSALSIYKKLRDQAGYPSKYGFALLDHFMWQKGHKLIYGWA